LISVNKSWSRHIIILHHSLKVQPMDSGLLGFALIVGIGIFLYFLANREQARQARQAKEAEDKRISQSSFADHFADLAGKGIQIKINVDEPANVALHNGEELLCVFPETTLVEPRAVRTWLGAYGGSSIRIAKGLSLRFGQSRGQSESHEELRTIDIGTLVLTNERIVFVGLKRSSSVPLKKIISVEGFSDALLVRREGKQKTEEYQLSPGKQMSYEYDGQMLAAPLDGNLIKGIIDFAIIAHQNLKLRAFGAMSNGNRLLAQGNPEAALKSYRDSLAIVERLAEADPGNTDLQQMVAGLYVNVGDALTAQGNLEEALKSQSDGLAIRGRLMKAYPDKTDLQRGLLISYERVGDVLKEQGNLAQALKSQCDGLAIAERMVNADPGNTDLQNNLVVSYVKVGDVLTAQGNLEEALKSCRDALAIAKRLAEGNLGNSGLQRTLFVSYATIGDVLKEQGNLEEALKSYRDALAIAKRLAEGNLGKTQPKEDLRAAVGKISACAYRFVLTRNFSEAVDAIGQAISVAPDRISLYIIRAHALMFLGRVDEARAIYLGYRDHQKVQGEKSWEAVVLEDFAQLQKARLTHPLMDEIERVLSAPRTLANEP
jgi:tetratricopeptide (TPR) repeat protein